ncbi:MAG: hypothetical protein JSV31_25315 [Desulfobacterales bacterium]|nr:MAG: hypothetical protein JSV31_25315 [Desulfobacterales bacterium]
MENLKIQKKLSEKNSKTLLPKKISAKISRTFSIMFNRLSMYKMDHPFTVQSIGDVLETVTDGLNIFSPIVVVFNRDQFFIEEEPFDQRLNTSRLIAHFKKAGIQSISFEKGVKRADLDKFVKIFADLKNYPTAVSMKNALAERMVSNIKINHVIYKKVTADDEIVSKEELKGISADGQGNASAQMYGEVLNMMAESILMEEVEKSISLESLLAAPEKLSKELIDKDLSLAQNGQTELGNPGALIADQLVKIKDEVKKVSESTDKVGISELADAVFEMKKELIEGIESQKTLGVIYENEKQILDEANALTDQVLIQLVKEEYKKGDISIQRLAQILKRLVPETNELKRLLPKLREAMLEEGMSKADFLQLIDALGKELQNENLMEFLHKGAEEIGVTSEDLIDEFKNDPSGAAELIYLASELRQGTGDEKVLTDFLVEYIERLGSKIALDDTESGEQEAGNHLREVIANVESEIVSKLKKKGVDEDVLGAVQQRLAERMEMCFSKLKLDLERRQATSSSSATEDMGKSTIFRVLEESVEEGDELHKILIQVRASVKESDIDENNFQQIYEEISKRFQDQPKKKHKKKLPSDILNYKSTLLFIEKEISRSIRYETPFSAITFSIEKIIPEQPIARGALEGLEINKFIMGELVNILRGSDIVGILSKKIIVVLLPMTEKMSAKVALNRILKTLHTKSFNIKGIPLKVKFGGVVTSFDHDQTPDLDSFISTAENEHTEFLIRLRNVQDLY